MTKIGREIKRAKLHDWYLDTGAGRYECRDCPAVMAAVKMIREGGVSCLADLGDRKSAAA